MNNYHTSVLLQEVIDFLKIKPGHKYIDATLGGGGHTVEMLRQGGDVLGIDVDSDAHAYVESLISSRKEELNGSFRSAYGNFEKIDEIAHQHHFISVSGIIFDLGVSSHQFDTPERGFSFQPGPLDMRMDGELTVTAADLINGLTRVELIELFEKYGEEPFARKIAGSIAERRIKSPFRTTEDLAEVIKRAVPKSDGIHPATRVFQALRIAVNDEMHVLENALPKALRLLENEGRLTVISFHSLEDRIVKYAFEAFEKAGEGEIITKKPIIPTQKEQEENRRSRSAKLRVFERKI